MTGLAYRLKTAGDANGKIYIVYTISEVMDGLGCSNKKAVRILRGLNAVVSIPHFVKPAEREIFANMSIGETQNKRRKAHSRKKGVSEKLAVVSAFTTEQVS